MINITAFSFISALIYFNLYIILLTLMRRHNRFIIHFSLAPLVFIVAISVFRLLFSVELPFTIGIDSTRFLPNIVSILTVPCYIGRLLRIIDIVIIIWISGTVYWLKNYIIQITSVSKLLNSIPPTTNRQILRCMEGILKESKKNTKVKIIQLPQFTTPMIIGIFRPVICLPQIDFTNEELKNILQHEWSHYMHKDAWIKLFVYILSTIFWWNPFIHLFRKELDHILEIQCDLRITKKMNEVERISYLDSVMKIIKLKPSCKKDSSKSYIATASMLISTNKHIKIKQRFQLVIHQKQKGSNSKYPAYLLCFFMLLSCCASYSVVIQPSYQPPKDTFSITPQNACLKLNGNGTYSLYVDGNYISQVEVIDKEPFSSLPIIHK